MLAQVQAVKIGSRTSREPYDLMKLFARVLYHYKGAIADADFDRMDYRRFFGYVRELDLILEEEHEATKENSNGNVQTTLSQIPQANDYDGEVIKLV